MSSLWTPDGERPVGPAPGAPDGASQGEAPIRRPGAAGSEEHGDHDEEALAEQVAAMRAELANSPAEVVVANHCYGLFELAAVYLSQQPALLGHARLAIDALGSLIDGLEGRLGDAEPQLKDGLSQLRVAFVQIEGAKRAGADVASGAGANGGPADGGADRGATGDGAADRGGVDDSGSSTGADSRSEHEPDGDG